MVLRGIYRCEFSANPIFDAATKMTYEGSEKITLGL